MGLFDFFRRKPKKQINEQHFQDKSRNLINGIRIKRNDGIDGQPPTYLEIEPVIMDKDGDQESKQVYNVERGEVQNIWIYRVTNEFMDGAGELTFEIYMPYEAEKLENPFYQDIIANKLLPHDRLKKVVEQYAGYTGVIRFGPNGRYRKEVEQSVVDALQREKSNTMSSISEHQNNNAQTGRSTYYDRNETNER